LGVQAHAAPENEAPPEPFEDFAGVLKAESCSVWRSLAHLGQVIGWFCESTTRS